MGDSTMKIRLFVTTAMMALLFLGSGSTRAEYWSHVGIENVNYMRALAANNHNQVYVGTDNQGAVYCADVFIAPDRWDKICRPAGADVVQTLLNTPMGLFIGTRPGKVLYLYDNNRVCAPTAELGDISGVWSLAFYHFFNDYIVAGTSPEGRVYESGDGGATWQDRGVPEEGYDVFTLAIDGTFGIYAGTNSGDVYYSSFGTTRWNKLGELPDADIVHKLVFQHDGRLLAATGTSGLIYASDDYGETWFLHGQLPDTSNVMSLVQDSNGDLYAGTYPNCSIYKYHDSVEGWKLTAALKSGDPISPTFVFDLAVSPSQHTHIWAATGPNGRLFYSLHLDNAPSEQDSGSGSGCFINSLPLHSYK